MPAPLEPMTVAKSPGSRWRDRSRMAALFVDRPRIKGLSDISSFSMTVPSFSSLPLSFF